MGNLEGLEKSQGRQPRLQTRHTAGLLARPDGIPARWIGQPCSPLPGIRDRGKCARRHAGSGAGNVHAASVSEAG